VEVQGKCGSIVDLIVDLVMLPQASYSHRSLWSNTGGIPG
jgi:hypothetical protein